MNLDFIDAAKKKRTKPHYQKPDSVKELERLFHEQKKAKHPDVPYLPKTAFRDDSASGLTQSIIAWLKLNGHFAARVNVTGIYDVRLGKYRRSGARKGMADISAVVKGRHVSIEVKTGRDRMRPDQLKVKSEVEAAGGVYIVVSSFDDFLRQINVFLK